MKTLCKVILTVSLITMVGTFFAYDCKYVKTVDIDTYSCWFSDGTELLQVPCIAFIAQSLSVITLMISGTCLLFYDFFDKKKSVEAKYVVLYWIVVLFMCVLGLHYSVMLIESIYVYLSN